MEIKLVDLLNYKNSYENIHTKNMSVNLAYKFAKLYTHFKDEYEFYQTQLNQILDKYAERDENNKYILNNDGSSIKILPDVLEQCQEEISNLEKLTIHVDIKPFTINELSELNMSIDDMQGLLPFITEE